MRAVIQVVKQAKVEVDNKIIAEIDKGYLILLAVSVNDTENIIAKMADKISKLRIFGDENNKMNLSLKEVDGEILLVSQFTLYGDITKGNRPSFTVSAHPDKAEPYYLKLADALTERGLVVKMGQFGAHMAVSLVNNGPTTIIIDL